MEAAPLDVGLEPDASGVSFVTFFLPPNNESRIDCSGSVFLLRMSLDVAVCGLSPSSSGLPAAKLDLAEFAVTAARRMLLASELERPKNDDRLRTLCRLAVSEGDERRLPTRLDAGDIHDESGLLFRACGPVPSTRF